MPSLNRLLIDTPRWLLLGVIFLSPWAYGSTPPWTVGWLEIFLCVILALWLISNAIRGLKAFIPPLVLGCAAAILAWGWWMTINPHYQDAGGYRFNPVHPLVSGAPGTVDQASSFQAMLRISCLLALVCFVCDLATRREWRRRIWRTIAVTGISVIVFGLIQSALGKPLLIWKQMDPTAPYFATYYYHGNAGSFINLVLPFIAGLAALTLTKPDEHLARALWFPGFFICVAGAFVNLSRAAMVITVLLCAVLLTWQFTGKYRNELLPPRRLRLVYAALVAGGLAAMVAFSGWQRPAEKWALMERQLNSSNKRLIATKICLKMLPTASWHGFGPGTFGLVFPHYTGADADLIPGIWRYAHDDYLQCMLEWGAWSIFWGVLFFGGMFQLAVQWRKRRDLSTADRVLTFVSFVALLGVALHAMVDFPLQIASLQLYAAICVGFGWSCSRWEGTLQHSKDGSATRTARLMVPMAPPAATE